MHINFNKNLLNLKGVRVKYLKRFKNRIEIHIETKVKEHICPHCGNITTKIHDYRTQKIKDIPIYSTPTFLVLKKRRYVCKYCGKKFYEKLDFLPVYYQTTNRFNFAIIDALKERVSMSHIAKEFSVSVPTVINRLHMVSYSLTKMPDVLSIDEFKGNSDNIKYHCSLVDPVKGKILDIIKDRKDSVLVNYMKKLKDRDKVRIFIMDMWEPYKNIAKTFFKNALIVIDKYHYVRQNTWAFEAIRKREQSRLGTHATKLFKNSKRLLLKNPDKLAAEEKLLVNTILLYSEELRQAYNLKKMFYEFSKSESYKEAKEKLSKFVLVASSSNLKEYVELSRTLVHWSVEILNSFKTKYTNGCMEGKNNKIKVLKRVSFGFRNFDNFRTRILHCEN